MQSISSAGLVPIGSTDSIAQWQGDAGRIYIPVSCSAGSMAIRLIFNPVGCTTYNQAFDKQVRGYREAQQPQQQRLRTPKRGIATYAVLKIPQLTPSHQSIERTP